MEIIINEIFNHTILTNGKDKITRKIINEETLDKCFRKVYELERSARYNNYVYHKFVDENIEKIYYEWKQKNETITLYYGGGVVD